MKKDSPAGKGCMATRCTTVSCGEKRVKKVKVTTTWLTISTGRSWAMLQRINGDATLGRACLVELTRRRHLEYCAGLGRATVSPELSPCLFRGSF